MKIRRFLKEGVAAIAVLVAAMAITPLFFAQGAQPVGMQPQVAVSAGRNVATGDALGLNNIVQLDFRHCQKYAKTTGFWFWKKVFVDQEACNADPTTLFASETKHNLVNDGGFDAISKMISDTAAQPAACNFIELAIDTSNAGVGTVAAADTLLETSGTTTVKTADGLDRIQGVFAHTTGTKTYTVTKVFTAGATHSVNKTGLFNIVTSSTITMCYEVLFTSVTVNNLDTLTVFGV